jgi:hypothetical protein
MLRTFREVGLLHAWERATAADGSRPSNPQQVTWLDLNRTDITDAGLKELVALPNLTALDLTYSKIGDAGLKELFALKKLVRIDLSGTKVTVAGLKELAGIKTLKWVRVPYSIPEGGIAELRADRPDLLVEVGW